MIDFVQIRSLKLTPNESVCIRPRYPLKISNIALGPPASESGASSRAVIQLSHAIQDHGQDSVDAKLNTIILCSLIREKVRMRTFDSYASHTQLTQIEQSVVDIVLSAEVEYSFEVLGDK